MAYLGTNPANQNELLRTAALPRDAERFSGNGSTTTFTLSRTLYGPTDAEVVVENVQQEPVVAYDIVGNQLVFTEAPPSGTYNIYVVYRAVQGAQVTLPDGSVSYNKLANNIRLFTTDNYVGNSAISTYALSEAPADANTLSVSIDGIVQRAPINYTVSGQTITFTSAPPTGANVHIKHLGFRSSATITAVPANTTIVQPVLSNPTITLAAENSSFKGNVALYSSDGANKVGQFGATAAGQVQLDVGANTLSVRSSTIALANVTSFSVANTSGATGISVDAASRFTMPNQPAFYAGINSNADASVSQNATIPFNILPTSFAVNKGSHFNTSTYRFTAPVAGLYRFFVTTYWTSGGGAYNAGMQIAIRVNDNYITTGQDTLGVSNLNIGTGAGQITVGSSMAELLVQLNVNDYVTAVARSATFRHYQGHAYFGGYLIG